MRWSELEDQQPKLSALARQRLVEPGVLLVVTLRLDGTPRLSLDPWTGAVASGTRGVRWQGAGAKSL